VWFGLGCCGLETRSQDVLAGSHSVQVGRPLLEVGAGAGCGDELACRVEFDVDGIAGRVAAARHDVPAMDESLNGGVVDLLDSLPA
jgi:hypothetical protein